jgi:glycosyltransferase involved in cell wall biosynthesis
MKKKLVLISAYEMSFVKNDISLLQKGYEVTQLLMPGISKSKGDVFRSVLRIFWAVLRHDVVYCWFADFRAWVAVKCARMLGKKAVVVVGGYEVVSMPEIDYGGLLHAHMTPRLIYTLTHAHLVLAVSQSSMRQIVQVAQPSRLQCIYNGVNLQRFTPSGSKEKLVLTVGIVKRANLTCKGLITFALVAAQMPDVQFVLIGQQPDSAIQELRNIAPPNLQCIDFLPQDELLHWYRRAKVYAQLSAQESFCLALAEAMLCNCIPVTTDRGALPEVRGDFGYEVRYNDVAQTVDAIRAALDAEVDTRQRAHIQQFSDARRQRELLQALEQI